MAKISCYSKTAQRKILRSGLCLAPKCHTGTPGFNVRERKLTKQLDYILINEINQLSEECRIISEHAMGQTKNLATNVLHVKLNNKMEPKCLKKPGCSDLQVDLKTMVENTSELDSQLKDFVSRTKYGPFTMWLALKRALHRSTVENIWRRKKRKPWVTDEVLTTTDERSSVNGISSEETYQSLSKQIKWDNKQLKKNLYERTNEPPKSRKY